MTQVLSVVVICPHTNTRVDTGIETTTREAFAAEYPWDQTLIACPACGQKHTWSPSKAILQIDGNRSEDSSAWRPNR